MPAATRQTKKHRSIKFTSIAVPAMSHLLNYQWRPKPVEQSFSPGFTPTRLQQSIPPLFPIGLNCRIVFPSLRSVGNLDFYLSSLRTVALNPWANGVVSVRKQSIAAVHGHLIQTAEYRMQFNQSPACQRRVTQAHACFMYIKKWKL